LDWLLRITSSVVAFELNLSLIQETIKILSYLNICDFLMPIYERASLAANFGLLRGSEVDIFEDDLETDVETRF